MKVLAQKLRMLPVLIKTYAYQFNDHLVVITGVARREGAGGSTYRLALGVLFEGLCDHLETTGPGLFITGSLGLIRANVGI